MFTGGATMPNTPPMAMMAAVRSFESPRRTMIEPAIAPVVRTEAVEEPVIMPGNMIISMSSPSSRRGLCLETLFGCPAQRSSAPLSASARIRIIAVAMTRIGSR